MLFTSRDQDLSGIVAGARASVGAATAIVGCTTFGEITPSGATARSVLAMALGGDGITVRTALSRDARGRQRAAGTEVARELGRTGRPHEVLILIPDGAIGRHHEIVRGAYSIVGASVPMAGGCSGDRSYVKTHQFYGDHSGVEVLSASVTAVLIGSDGPIGVGLAHGWRAVGEPMVLTNSEETRIHEFDHQPALDVYLGRLGKDISFASDAAAMTDLTLVHPLGLARRSGEDIRVVESFDLADHSMLFFADVQQGALAWMMESDPESMIDSGGESCRQAIAKLDGVPPIGVIEFNCGVRKLLLRERAGEEVAKIVEAAAGAPVAGYYSMGEIARIRGTRGTHHMTAVSLAFG
jgi:hypothetical protein